MTAGQYGIHFTIMPFYHTSLAFCLYLGWYLIRTVCPSSILARGFDRMPSTSSPFSVRYLTYTSMSISSGVPSSMMRDTTASVSIPFSFIPLFILWLISIPAAITARNTIHMIIPLSTLLYLSMQFIAVCCSIIMISHIHFHANRQKKSFVNLKRHSA